MTISSELQQDSRGFYKCLVFSNKAQVGYKFNTVPDALRAINGEFDFEVIEVTNEFMSLMEDDDGLLRYVWCKYIGSDKQ